ncbi:hypothetical protein ACFSC4_21925 [Deinococcus malanensis]|uniref:hypothetical protein n=1 Tax=Deinococcus malanensis TaxID=1706855 RepID=UPI0036389A33
MRPYLILKAKVTQFDADPRDPGGAPGLPGRGGPRPALPVHFLGAQAVKARAFDRKAPGQVGSGLEHLVRLTLELLLGVRP